MAPGNVGRSAAASRIRAPGRTEDFRYLRQRRNGELAVQLPEDALRIVRLAGTRNPAPLAEAERHRRIVAELGKEWSQAFEEEQRSGTGVTKRFAAVTGELGDFIQGMPAERQDRLAKALEKISTYVQGGEQVDPNGVQATGPGFYEAFNRAVHEANSLEKLKEVDPEKARYFEALAAAHAEIPGEVEGVVFRGTALPKAEVAQYLDGSKRDFGQLAPMSTSLSARDGAGFAVKHLGSRDKVPTLMVIETRHGKLVATPDSAFRFEEEALLFQGRPMQFDVVDAFMAPLPKADEGQREVLYLFLREKAVASRMRVQAFAPSPAASSGPQAPAQGLAQAPIDAFVDP